MLDRNTLKLRKYLLYSAMMAGTVCLGLMAGKADALTAEDVLENMDADQLNGYLSGVVDGLATARWLAERPDASGMQCIYDWWLQTPVEPRLDQTMLWLERHPEQQVGILMSVLIGRECPTE